MLHSNALRQHISCSPALTLPQLLAKSRYIYAGFAVLDGGASPVCAGAFWPLRPAVCLPALPGPALDRQSISTGLHWRHATSYLNARIGYEYTHQVVLMDKILIANRGEIAVRICATCRRLGISTVAVYSEPDVEAPHVIAADEAFCIGAASIERSYLNTKAVLDAALKSGAHAVHPGYGFLSENSEFAAAVEANGLIWIGPPRAAMESMASKISARGIALEHDVPVIPAYTLLAADQIDADAIVNTTGVPMLIKSSAGGGGIGMRELHSTDDLQSTIEEARGQALRQFGSADLLIERLLSDARHIEVQVVGDQHGNLIHLFERDCSSQRRRQKILEETPAPDLPEAMRSIIQEAALRLARAVDYQGV
ncbi:MAG: biotin carboxylase N-terminal domain-containing protein, partial [Pseudomonadota bacterium]